MEVAAVAARAAAKGRREKIRAREAGACHDVAIDRGRHAVVLVVAKERSRRRLENRVVRRASGKIKAARRNP